MRPQPASRIPAVPTILVVNFHSAQNAGDLALLQMNLRQLQAGFAQARFLVTANHPAEAALQLPGVGVVPSAFAISGANRGASLVGQMLRLLAGVIQALLYAAFPGYGAKTVSGTGWAALLAAYRQADVVVSISGNYLLSMGRFGWPFPLTAYPIWAAHLFRKPFYAMPQSIGPFRRGWERWIVRQLYGRARIVYVRDMISLALAQKMSLGARTRFAPDPAFALPMVAREEALRILAPFGYQPGQLSLGLTVISPLTRAFSPHMIDGYYQDLAQVLQVFTQQTGARVYIFHQVTGPDPREDDRIAARRLLDLLPPGQERIVSVDADLLPEQLKACYGCMDLMVASRLHSGIFAMGAGVATLSIGYFTKARGLMQAMGLEDWLIELGKTDARQMEQKLNTAWEQRQQIAAQVRQKAGQFAAEVLTLGAQIRADLVPVRAGLRIAQLVKGLDAGGINGGSDIFGANLAAALRAGGEDARLIVFFQMNTPAEAALRERLAAQNLPVQFLQPWHGRTGLRAYWRGFRGLAAAMRGGNIDVLHSHFQIGTLMAAWLRLNGQVRRTVRTAHVYREWLRGWDGLVQQVIIRLMIFVVFPLLIDRESGVSQAAVDALDERWLARLVGKKARKIFNSIPAPDGPRLQQAISQTSAPKLPGSFVIGTVGRMTEQKGFDFLLEAVPAVLAGVPEARFVWIGDGPLRARLAQTAARMGVAERVCFTGVREDVPALLDTMDLFVLPSIYEGLPTVVLESMAQGVPVIGTDIPGTREIIQHGQNGWLVEPQSAPALAEAIVSLARSPQERARLAQGAAATLQEFSIERAAEQYAALYRELLP